MTKRNSTSISKVEQAQKTVNGVGYNSGGKYKTSINGQKSYEYITWHSMMDRCYNKKLQKRFPTYIGCKVCDEWHDFQVFAEWLNKNPYKGLSYHLDKDVLIAGNKLYSPETTRLIPQEINRILNKRSASRGKYPVGVSFDKSKQRFKANISVNGKTVCIGCFKCPNDAHEAYLLKKERYVKDKAIEWFDKIPNDVFLSLMSWSATN